MDRHQEGAVDASLDSPAGEDSLNNSGCGHDHEAEDSLSISGNQSMMAIRRRGIYGSSSFVCNAGARHEEDVLATHEGATRALSADGEESSLDNCDSRDNADDDGEQYTAPRYSAPSQAARTTASSTTYVRDERNPAYPQQSRSCSLTLGRRW